LLKKGYIKAYFYLTRRIALLHQLYPITTEATPVRLDRLQPSNEFNSFPNGEAEGVGERQALSIVD